MGTREGTGAPAGRGQWEGFLEEEEFELDRGSHLKEVVGDAENSRRGNSLCKGLEAGAAGGSSLKGAPFSEKPSSPPYLFQWVSPSLCPSGLSTQDSPDSSPPPKPPSCCRSSSASLSGPGVQPNPFRKGAVTPSLKTLLARGWGPGGVRVGRSHRLEAQSRPGPLRPRWLVESRAPESARPATGPSSAPSRLRSLCAWGVIQHLPLRAAGKMK